jgi:ribonuclease
MYILYQCGHCGLATVGQVEGAIANCMCGSGKKTVVLRSEAPIVIITLDEDIALRHIEPAERPTFGDARGVTPEALAEARSKLKHVEPASRPVYGDARGVTPQALAEARAKLRHVTTEVKQSLPAAERNPANKLIPMVSSYEKIGEDTPTTTAVLIPAGKATAIVAKDEVVKSLVHKEATHMVIPRSLYDIFRKFTAPGHSPLENDTYRNRVIAWTVVNQNRMMRVPALTGKQIRFWNPNQNKFSGYRADFGGRDLSKTLQRVAEDRQPVTSGFNAYDKKQFTNDRKNAYRLPLSPSESHCYYEYYVTHDSSAGRISGGPGAAGKERLVIGPPDHLFYTWDHYNEGSWFKYGWNTNTWTSL